MSPLEPDIETLLAEAVALPDPGERATFLDRACNDPAIRAEVARLADLHFRAGSFLDGPAAGLEPKPTPVPAAPPSGGWVGPYKLLEVIGEGGMGVVWMAEQADPVRRRVAVKLVRAGLDSSRVLARFEHERQALALMDHPNIARVLDAGAAADGRPYFVMELVHGPPIIQYCDEHRLDVAGRLRMFVDVCRAVQHAHHKGIIHRDLKPGNVLVARYDEAPVPKVIDFGVAKAVGPSLTDKTLFTGFGGVVGTPEYMSPEQAAPNQLDIDTRSDVYSLGVLLYELLTGTTPLSRERTRKAALLEVLRLVREEEPPTPSTRLSTADGRAGVAASRGTEPRHLAGQVKGELDWVTLRALEKDRNRRYDTAAALAQDVERYLNGDSVEAGRPSRWHRLRKAARRNRPILATAGLVAAALVAGTAVSVWQAVRATAAQHRAETAEQKAATDAATAREINRFLQTDVLRQVNGPPEFDDQGLVSDVTVRVALDRAAAKIGDRFQDQPLVEAGIRSAIGEAYASIFAHQSAVSHLERAAALREAHLGADHPDTIESLGRLAGMYSWLGRHQEGIALRQRALQICQSRFGPDSPETLNCLIGLTHAYGMAGQWDPSIPLLEQLKEKYVTTLGPTHPRTVTAIHNLAMQYGRAGRPLDSLAMHEIALAGFRASSNPEAPIWCLMTFAYECQEAGQLDRSEALAREAVVLSRKYQDGARMKTIRTANALGWLARTLMLKGQAEAAEPLIREALAVYEKDAPESHRRFYWMSLLGQMMLLEKKYTEAEPLLVKGYEGIQKQAAKLPAGSQRQQADAARGIIRYYEATNQPEKARQWQEKLPLSNRNKK